MNGPNELPLCRRPPPHERLRIALFDQAIDSKLRACDLVRLRMRIFAATAERQMLTSSTFSGHWEVVDCSPFPGGGATGGCFPGPGPFPAPEPATLALLGLGLASLGFSRRKRAH